MPELNGLDLGVMQTLVQTIQADASAAEPYNEWTARVRWQGGFKAQAIVRNHTFLIDEPADLVGKNEAPNAAEYLLGAYGACLTTGFVLNATKRGVRLRNLEVTVDGRIDNILTFLGMSDTGHPGYREIVAHAYVDAETDDKTLREIWDETVASSPVGNSLTRAVVVRAEVARV
jgi:uncharacterized OsmC-like protein